MKIDDRFFEVRLESEAPRFVPGERAVAKAKFLTWSLVAPVARPDAQIEIWEIGLVARGRVVSSKSQRNSGSSSSIA